MKLHQCELVPDGILRTISNSLINPTSFRLLYCSNGMLFKDSEITKAPLILLLPGGMGGGGGGAILHKCLGGVMPLRL